MTVTESIMCHSEGKYMQTVYRSLDYPYFRQYEHLTEDSSLVSESNKLLLYAEWARYWNTSKPVLVEKSPQHQVITRFAVLSELRLMETEGFCRPCSR